MAGPSVKERLIDFTVGSTAETCSPPAEPVRFGRKYWLAQHRWLEPVVGLTALLPVGAVYLLSFAVLTPVAAAGLMVLWCAFVAGGLVLRVRRPCTVLRLPIHALLVWLLALSLGGLLGLTPG